MAAEAIAGAFDLIAALLPEVGLVESVQVLEVRNPAAGFCVAPERLQRLTKDFGAGQATLLMGERLEYGKLVANDSIELDLDEMDFRSARACRMALLLPDEESASAAEKILPVLAERYGFEVAQVGG